MFVRFIGFMVGIMTLTGLYFRPKDGIELALGLAAMLLMAFVVVGKPKGEKPLLKEDLEPLHKALDELQEMVRKK